MYNPEVFFPFWYSYEDACFEDEYNSIVNFSEKDVPPSKNLRKIRDTDSWILIDKFLFLYFQTKDTDVLSQLQRFELIDHESTDQQRWNYIIRRFKVYFVVLFIKRIWTSNHEKLKTDIATTFEQAYPRLIQANRNVGKEKETKILRYFNSIDSDNFFIEHAIENTWNSTYRNIFDDFGYRYCLVHIKKDPNLLRKMSGIGATTTYCEL